TALKRSVLDLAASAVADGSAIDWARVKGGANERERRLIDQLQLIAMIAHQEETRQPAMQASRAQRSRVATTAKRPTPCGHDDVKRWGNLILIEEVGSGSFGTVYRAHDPELDRPVAVKLLKSASSADDKRLESWLLHEGQALARVEHPNVVKVYDVG